MLRVLFISILFFLIACSKDKPAPVAPAGKAQAVLEAPAAPTNLRFEGGNRFVLPGAVGCR